MDKQTLIKELNQLAEANELTNPHASTILYTLASLCGEEKEIMLVETADKINDIFLNQLK